MAITDVNYLNPSSIAPGIGWQPQANYAGWIWNQRNQDYQKLMEQQMRLQNISEQERNLGLQEKLKDIPIKDLERSLTRTAGQAKLPILGQAVSEDLLAQIGKNKFDREVTYGDIPGAQKAITADRQMKRDKYEWEKYTREQAVMQSLLENAIKMGPIDGLNYITQEANALQARGINVPSAIKNPANWAAMNNALVNSIAQQQKIAQERVKGEQEREARHVSGGYQVQAAREAAKSRVDVAGMKDDKVQTTTEARVNEVERNIGRMLQNNDPNVVPYIKTEAIPAWSNDFDDQNKSSSLGMLRNHSEEGRKKYDAAKDTYILKKLKNYLQVVPENREQQSQTAPNNDPLGLFKK